MSEVRRTPRVVIVGSGFGGIEATKALARAPVEVILIDRENHHCFQPLLYQVATAALSPADIAWPIRAMFRTQSNARVLMAEVSAVDPARRRISADGLELDYDFLVLATGVTHSYFGHDEWRHAAPGLKRIADATDIRRRFLIAFEHAELIDAPPERIPYLTFVIVGGGPTGVEMAGAMAEVSRQTLARDFRNIDPTTARIILIEAGPRLLPTFPEDLSRYAERSLQRMGVQVMLGARVTACDDDGVSLDHDDFGSNRSKIINVIDSNALEHDVVRKPLRTFRHHALGSERIAARTILWAAGVAASAASAWIDAERDRMGRIKVGPDLTVPGHPEIFAIGDIASVVGSERPIPGIAPAAKQMGRYAGRVIAARASGKAPPGPFVYRHYGDLATIGRKAAVVRIGRIRLTGFIGWLFWGVAHIYFLIGVRNRVAVALNWLWDYLTFQRGARLISNPPR